MADYRFDTDTATIPADGGIAVNLNADWNVDGTILNGGYLQAVIVRAAQAALPSADGIPAPMAVSTSYVAAARPGPALVSVQELRRGSTLIFAQAQLLQDERVVAVSLITFSTAANPSLAPAAGPWDPTMPTVTGAADSIRVPQHQLPGPPGLAALIDYAFVPEASRWLGGDTSGGPRIRCWLSFADQRPIDLLAAVALVDIAPPVCFALGNLGWAPTIQLQVALFAAPAEGPVLLDLAGSPYSGPIVAEDALLWDSRGTLIANARQVALAPRR